MLVEIIRNLASLPQDQLEIVKEVIDRLLVVNGADFYKSLAEYLNSGNTKPPPLPIEDKVPPQARLEFEKAIRGVRVEQHPAIANAIALAYTLGI